MRTAPATNKNAVTPVLTLGEYSATIYRQISKKQRALAYGCAGSNGRNKNKSKEKKLKKN